MSHTRRTPRPWDYRWQTREDYDAHVRRCALLGRHATWPYKPWKNHYVTWGASRRCEIDLANSHLRTRTHAAMQRQLAFWHCTCLTRWPCPLHGDGLPADTPDWHPGVIRVGYFD